MLKSLLTLIIFLSITKIIGQVKPSIGLNGLPADTTKICTIPWYLGSFYTSGYQQGDTVPDFKLYSLNGDSLVLSKELQGGKPVLLIAGSLTCPVFRNKVATINQVVSTYSSKIKVFIIYTAEAHPTDTSPYSGRINVTTANINAGILFPQPKTYGARKKLVDTMSKWVTVNAPIFIDGPCNKWWSNYGPAPNNSYLISPNGVVLNKHGWFHRAPDDIFCDLDSILSLNSGLCSSTSQPGSFSLSIVNSTVQGTPGSVLYDNAKIVNTSTFPVTVYIRKTQKVLPSTWQTAFCIDVCYGTNDDSVVVTIPPSTTQDFSLDFFTGATPDSGRVKVGFRNTKQQSNFYTQWFKATTVVAEVGINSSDVSEVFKVFPNPFNDHVNIDTKSNSYSVKITDALGRIIIEGNTARIETLDWPPGIYFLNYRSENKTVTVKMIKAP